MKHPCPECGRENTSTLRTLACIACGRIYTVHGTVNVNGRNRLVMDVLRDGPGGSIVGYKLTGYTSVYRVGNEWKLDAPNQFVRVVKVEA